MGKDDVGKTRLEATNTRMDHHIARKIEEDERKRKADEVIHEPSSWDDEDDSTQKKTRSEAGPRDCGATSRPTRPAQRPRRPKRPFQSRPRSRGQVAVVVGKECSDWVHG